MKLWRYHAKTAEIAGQNLAHVNDETYARQRVLAREGVMYGSFGELQTSGLEAGGLDHARSELLDKRVVNELSETASLEARQEILDLLQGALGETITRNGINVGLDDLHDSDLAQEALPVHSMISSTPSKNFPHPLMNQPSGRSYLTKPKLWLKDLTMRAEAWIQSKKIFPKQSKDQSMM